MSSPVYLAKARAFALLDGWAWPDVVPTVQWAEPLKPDDFRGKHHVIWFAGDLTATVPETGLYMAGGATNRSYQQTFPLRVIVDVYWAGDEPQEAEHQADLLYEQAVLAFDTDPALAGTVNRLGPWTSRRVIGPNGQSGWRAQATLEQSVTTVVSNP